MFVRINKSGRRRSLQVVESYRNEAGQPRHRVVANPGRIDAMQDGHLDALIRGLCRVAGRDELQHQTSHMRRRRRLEMSSRFTRFGKIWVSTALWGARFDPESGSWM